MLLILFKFIAYAYADLRHETGAFQ